MTADRSRRHFGELEQVESPKEKNPERPHKIKLTRENVSQVVDELNGDSWLDINGRVDSLGSGIQDSIARKIKTEAELRLAFSMSAYDTIKRAFQGLFKSGLKEGADNPFEDVDFKAKLNTRQKKFSLGDKKNILSIFAYDIAVHLTPRYQVNDKPGVYVFTFCVVIKRVSKGDNRFKSELKEYGDKLVYITTLTDNKTSQVASDLAEFERVLSALETESAKIGALKTTASAGAPGSKRSS